MHSYVFFNFLTLHFYLGMQMHALVSLKRLLIVCDWFSGDWAVFHKNLFVSKQMGLFQGYLCPPCFKSVVKQVIYDPQNKKHPLFLLALELFDPD